MTSKLDIIAAHVASRGWTFERLGDQATLRVELTRCVVLVHAPERYFAVNIRALYPHEVPPDRRNIVMEYITRANTHVEVGHFELDLDKGRIAFRTGMWTRNVQLTHEILLNLFDTNTFGYRAYVGGLEAVIAGTETVEDAILDAEERS